MAELPDDRTRLDVVREITGGLAVAGDRLLVRATVPLKPFRLATVIVELALAPSDSLSEAGFAPIEKSAALPTDTRTVAEWERDPLVPATVTV